MRKASSILKPKKAKPVISLRLPESLVSFLDNEVKRSKVEGATRNELVQGILEDWAKNNGYKK